MILRLLGMSESYLERLKAWTDGVTRALTSFDPQPQWLEALEVVVTEMVGIFRGEIEERRRDPALTLSPRWSMRRTRATCSLSTRWLPL